MAVILQLSLWTIFITESTSIFIQISLEFLPDGPINNKPSLVQITGAKPVSEATMA